MYIVPENVSDYKRMQDDIVCTGKETALGYLS